jgi:hypothetical protein
MGAMHRVVAPFAVVAVLLTGCSSGTGKPAAKSAATPVNGATSSPAAATSSSTDIKTEALECGMFDIGAVYLNDEWPAIIGGHPRFGYGLNLEKAADTWQQGLNSYSSGESLDSALGRAVSGVHDMETAMAQSDGSAPVEIGTEVRQIQDAFTTVSAICADINYHMTQPLKQQ